MPANSNSLQDFCQVQTNLARTSRLTATSTKDRDIIPERLLEPAIVRHVPITPFELTVQWIREMLDIDGRLRASAIVNPRFLDALTRSNSETSDEAMENLVVAFHEVQSAAFGLVKVSSK